MAACVRAAARHRLQVVAQVHTHPRQAFHSEGDVEGARIRYPGYASIVLPDYGDRLPSLEGAAAFVFTRSSWVDVKASDVILVPDRCDG
jgi:proteasome lid subunit RPN8/RPN11